MTGTWEYVTNPLTSFLLTFLQGSAFLSTSDNFFSLLCGVDGQLSGIHLKIRIFCLFASIAATTNRATPTVQFFSL